MNVQAIHKAFDRIRTRDDDSAIDVIIRTAPQPNKGLTGKSYALAVEDGAGLLEREILAYEVCRLRAEGVKRIIDGDRNVLEEL
jgi:hypothetical protein